MLLEWLESLATPCPRDVRDLGYRRELIAIGARRQRCRAAWADHIARSRQAILDAVGLTERRRIAVVFGSGRLLDVPVAELARAFQRVILVDALHPLTARLQARRHANVELVSADVTGTIAALHRLKRGEPLPPPRRPARLADPAVDFVVSLNLLSQLGVIPAEWLERQLAVPAPQAEAFARSLTQAHLDDLAACPAAVCLIADVEAQFIEPGGKIEKQSSIYGIAPPPAVAEWIWQIAPAPEDHPTISEQRRVIVAHNPGRQAGG
jgi:hypothetical protein